MKMKSDIVFIVRFDQNAAERELRFEKGLYKDTREIVPEITKRMYNRATLLDLPSFAFHRMTFVVTDFEETGSRYKVFFEEHVFKLSKRNQSGIWYKYNDVFEIYLCKTAAEMWKCIRGFYHELVKDRKRLLGKIAKSQAQDSESGEWEEFEEEDTGYSTTPVDGMCISCGKETDDTNESGWCPECQKAQEEYDKQNDGV